MIIPDDAVIPLEKLTRYLLVPRPWDDKSKFLARAGFTLDNPDILLASLRGLAIGAEGMEDGTNEYGTFYRIEGPLVGPIDRPLDVVTIWLCWHSDSSFHFVTLKPRKASRP
jgi:hypothetical protein